MQSETVIKNITRRPSRLADIELLLDKVVDRLRERFGTDLVSVVLYGSYARGQADTGSDIDLLVVVPGLPEEWRDIFALEDELMAIGRDVGQRLDIRLAEPQAISYSVTWAAPLILEIYDAHHVLFDRGGFFAAEMARLANVMRERGVAKIAPGVWRMPPVANE